MEQLNVIRHDLNGDGEIDDLTSNDPSIADSKAAAYVAAFHGVLPPTEDDYAGYELAAALDFAGSRWALDATTDGTADAVFEGWEPIGYSGNPYLNTFEGNSRTITGLCINRPDTDSVGLFGIAGEGAIIRNVFLEEVSVLGRNHVGGLVGDNVGTITSSYVTGDVSGNDGVGGLVGENHDDITSSYATGDVSGNGRVGGLVGVNLSTITSSYATGTVNGNNRVGGLVGSQYGYHHVQLCHRQADW